MISIITAFFDSFGRCPLVPFKLSKFYMHLIFRDSVHLKLKLHCTVCTQSFSNAFRLKDHMKSSHTNSKGYSCNLCSSTLVHSTSIKRHFQTMHGLFDLTTKEYLEKYCVNVEQETPSVETEPS